MADEFDIYGDDAFDTDLQSDDILGEIVGEPSSSQREAKRRKKEAEASHADDDLFEDFGEIDRETKTTTTEQPQRPPQTAKQPNASQADHKQTTSQSPLQKIPSSVQSTPRPQYDSPSASRKELPMGMTSLRGITTHVTSTFYLGEFPWYVTDENVKQPLNDAGLGSELKELTFSEHKVNGKSRGICFLEFSSPEVAAKAKDVYENSEIDGKRPVVCFASIPNPFRHNPKESAPKTQRSQQMNPRMNAASGGAMMGGFNPMMNSNFNPAFAGMGMNPYGGYNPMATMAARGGYMNNFDGMMGMQGSPGGNRGNRGGMGMRGSGPSPYMNRMGRGGGMMGNSSGGMYINPAFFDQQQGGGSAGGN